MKSNRNKIIALISAIIVLTTTFVSTANAGSAGGAAAYLKMGVSARALGMGEAFTAIADDASATYYNPAGLGGLKKREFTTMHAMLKLDRKFDFANYVLPDPKRNGVWGFSWTKFGVDEIPETQLDLVTDPNGNTPHYVTPGDPNSGVKIFSYFSDSENNYTLSYGKQHTDKVRLGANIKYLTHSLFDKSANGIGMDFGYHITSDEKTSFGLAVKNVGAKLKWNTEGNTTDSIPVTTVLGAAYKIHPKILSALDFEKTGNEDLKLKLGVEGKINEKIALRGGVNNKKFSIGAGFYEKQWNFDYAFYDEELGASHRISAGYRF